VTFDLDLDFEHTVDAGPSGTIVCKFVRDPAICLREEAIFAKSQNCPYHVTFDLDLDLEHILDAGPCGDHRMRSSHVCGRRSDFRVIRKVSVSRDLRP